MIDDYNNFDYPGREQNHSGFLSTPGCKPVEPDQPLIKADDISYILFEKKDLARQKQFLLDFGLLVAEESEQALFMRARGDLPYVYAAIKSADRDGFLGAGFSVKDERDLLKISQHTGVAISAVDGPGGGSKVRLTDPDGFIVDVVWGRAAVEQIPLRDAINMPNQPYRKSRINSAVRSAPEPSALSRLGHYVISVADFQKSLKWYSKHIGIIPTDVQCLEDGTPALAFNRLNRGEQPADHHTVVLVQNVSASYMHCAFETIDIDSLGQGQQYLKHRGWQHFWGIGRHILGSQLFDYWLDPTGDELEHYADGDVFDCHFPTQYHPLDLGSLWAWGQDVPKAMRPKFSFGQILHAIKAIRSGSLTGKTLKMMKRATGLPARPWLK